MASSEQPVPVDAPVPAKPGRRVSFREAVRVWARIGLTSFGGPAGQVALMHRVLVDEKRWIEERRFLHALNYCMLLPGPEAMQLATYVGWLLHGMRGGIVAGVLFVAPGFLANLALGMLYAAYGNVTAVAALFFGLKAAVLAVVMHAAVRLARRALVGRLERALAVLAFALVFFLAIPFPAIVAAAGVIGWITASRRARVPVTASTTPEAELVALSPAATRRPTFRRTAVLLVASLALWSAPVLLAALLGGADHVLVKEGVFFSEAAVVTFGGAYSVLGFVAQRAVGTYGWLLPGEMLDGLGLAETTPGPLILVLQFVGFLGAYRSPGALPPMLAGVLGATMTVWVTFVPCFLWIFLGAPYIERLRSHRGLSGALSAITAAVVGVIVDLSIWFGLHTAFGHVREHHVGPLRLLVPELASVRVASVLITLAAAIALTRKVSLPMVLFASASAGIAVRLLGLA